MKNNQSLTKREHEIMKALWQSDKALTASELSHNLELSISTVHASINKLLQKELIVIDDIIYSGNVLCRCYKAAISAKKYTMDTLISSFKGLITEDFSTSSFVSAFLGQEEDKEKVLKELNSLEEMIKKRKEELKQEMPPKK